MNNKTIHIERRDGRVKVIRCKDCIHHGAFLPACLHPEGLQIAHDDDFCSKGEQA